MLKVLILVGKIIVSHTPRVGLMSLLGRAGIVLLFYLSHAVCREKVEKCGLMDFDLNSVDMMELQQDMYYIYTRFPVPPCTNVALRYVNFCYYFLVNNKQSKSTRVGKVLILDNSTRYTIQKSLVLQGHTANCRGRTFTKGVRTLCCVSQLLEYNSFYIQRGKMNKCFALLIPKRLQSISIGYKDSQYEAYGYTKQYQNDESQTSNEDSDSDDSNDSSSDSNGDSVSDNTYNKFVTPGMQYHKLPLPLVSFTAEANPDYLSLTSATSTPSTTEHGLTDTSSTTQNMTLCNNLQEEFSFSCTFRDPLNYSSSPTDCTCCNSTHNKPNIAITAAVGFNALLGLSSFLFAVSTILGTAVMCLCWSRREKGSAGSSKCSKKCFGEGLVSTSSWTYFSKNSGTSIVRVNDQATIGEEEIGLEVITEGTADSSNTPIVNEEDEDDLYVEINPARCENQQLKEHLAPTFPMAPPTSVLQHSSTSQLHIYPLPTGTQETQYMNISAVHPPAKFMTDFPTNPSLTGISARHKKTRPSLSLMKQEDLESSCLFHKKSNRGIS